MLRLLGALLWVSCLAAQYTNGTQYKIPCRVLTNAAHPNLCMPVVGLGTGGYGSALPPPAYPECWKDPGCCPSPDKCLVVTAVKEWLKHGGRRIDNSNDYENEPGIAKGIAASGIDRKEIWITSKVGGAMFPLGYKDALDQFAATLKLLKTDYVDLLLIHWPVNMKHSSDPLCNKGAEYNATACRLNTWKALLHIFHTGGAKAVGVSNYNTSHLNEIATEGLALPSVVQNPFNPYRRQAAVKKYCTQHNIAFNSYSPLGVPDFKKYPAPMTPVLLQDPTLVKIAKAHKVSPAQVVLAWQWSTETLVNPRSANVEHMKENMDFFKVKLTAEELHQIGSLPQDYCSVDPSWYECIPDHED